MQVISRQELSLRLASDEPLLLVETLSPERYREFHLPHARNVPLDERFDEEIQRAVPDKRRAVAVYSLDESCPVSGRAAQRMTELGYLRVYDYTAGKRDWKEAGLPVEEQGGGEG